MTLRHKARPRPIYENGKLGNESSCLLTWDKCFRLQLYKSDKAGSSHESITNHETLHERCMD